MLKGQQREIKKNRGGGKRERALILKDSRGGRGREKAKRKKWILSAQTAILSQTGKKLQKTTTTELKKAKKSCVHGT